MNHTKPYKDKCMPRTYTLTNEQHDWLAKRAAPSASALLREIVAREMARVARKEGK